MNPANLVGALHRKLQFSVHDGSDRVTGEVDCAAPMEGNVRQGCGELEAIGGFVSTGACDAAKREQSKKAYIQWQKMNILSQRYRATSCSRHVVDGNQSMSQLPGMSRLVSTIRMGGLLFIGVTVCVTEQLGKRALEHENCFLTFLERSSQRGSRNDIRLEKAT